MDSCRTGSCQFAGDDILMKAYQFKITLEGTKPEVWRRCWIPADYTLQQAAEDINIMFDWSGMHLADFSLPDGRTRVTVKPSLFGGADVGAQWSERDASEITLAQFVGDNPWICYIYDFGDEWEHKMVVESVSHDYPHDYAQVIEAQGGNPPEDSGGASSVGRAVKLFTPFHRDRVNDILAQNVDMDDDWDDDTDGDDDDYGYDDMADDYDDTDDQEDGDLVDIRGTRYRCASFPLEDTLVDFRKCDLVETAEVKGFSIPKTLPKAMYRKRLCKAYLEPDTVRSHLMALGPEEMVTLVKLLDITPPAYMARWQFHDGKGASGTEELPLFGLPTLISVGYLGTNEYGNHALPADVADAMRRVLTADFWQEYHDMNWLVRAASFAGMIYGVFPVGVLMQLLHQHEDFTWTEQQVMEKLDEIPSEYPRLQYESGMLWGPFFFADDPEAEAAMSADIKGYALPSEEEVYQRERYDQKGETAITMLLRMFSVRYDPSVRAWLIQALSQLIDEGVANTTSMAELKEMWEEELLDDGIPHGVIVDAWQKARPLLMKLRSHIRRPALHGFTEYELKEQERQAKREQRAAQKAAKSQKVVSLSARRRRKHR